MKKPKIKCLFPLEDHVEFAKRYQIRETNYVCENCGKIFELNIPIFIKNYAGLVTQEHDCGPQYIQIRIVPRTIDAKNKWKEILE